MVVRPWNAEKSREPEESVAKMKESDIKCSYREAIAGFSYTETIFDCLRGLL